ncbi:MAG: hypothetical protein U1E51_21765 [Candidatus Binatia bacterium]|nr:hypothetical protein [Candidatus Binatia bacterium]
MSHPTVACGALGPKGSNLDHPDALAIHDFRTVAAREAGNALDDAIRHLSFGDEPFETGVAQ